MLLAAEAGLRAGEVRGLQWGDVVGGQLTVRRRMRMADNLGSGPTRAAHVDLPYAPGFYSVTCTSMWQEKSNSTHFFSSGGPFVGGNF